MQTGIHFLYYFNDVFVSTILSGEMFDYIVSHKYVHEKQACIFFHQIIDGLESIHKNDVTHRDLKPENLLLKYSPDGWVVKIVDFGLSNTHENGRLLSTACGSPCYAAPEMIKGLTYKGPMADLWSCGVILFALVCGHLPFEDQNTAKLYEKILSGHHKPSAWCSPEVKDLLKHILEVDPNKRYTIAEIRKHPWYMGIQPHQVPTDTLTEVQQKTTMKEIFDALSSAGLDMAQIEDGLASKLCNSATATYYLMEQKAKNYYQEKREMEAQVSAAAIVDGGGEKDRINADDAEHGPKSPRSNTKTEAVVVKPQSTRPHSTKTNRNPKTNSHATAVTSATTAPAANTAYKNKTPIVPKLDLKPAKVDPRKQDVTTKKNVPTVTQSARDPHPPKHKSGNTNSRNSTYKTQGNGSEESTVTPGIHSARAVMISNPPTTATIDVAKNPTERNAEDAVGVTVDISADVAPLGVVETSYSARRSCDVVQPLGAGTPGIQTPEDRPSTRRSRQRASRGPSRTGTSHSRVGGDDGLSGLTGIHPPDGVPSYGGYGNDMVEKGTGGGVDGPGMGRIPMVPQSGAGYSNGEEDAGTKIEITITGEDGADEMENYTTQLIGNMMSPVIALEPEPQAEAEVETTSPSSVPSSGHRYSPGVVAPVVSPTNGAHTTTSPIAIATNSQHVSNAPVRNLRGTASNPTGQVTHGSAYTKAPVIPNMAPRSNHSSHGNRKGRNIVLNPIKSPRNEKGDKEFSNQRRVVALNASPYIRENKLNSVSNSVSTHTSPRPQIPQGQPTNQILPQL